MPQFKPFTYRQIPLAGFPGSLQPLVGVYDTIGSRCVLGLEQDDALPTGDFVAYVDFSGSVPVAGPWLASGQTGPGDQGWVPPKIPRSVDQNGNWWLVGDATGDAVASSLELLTPSGYSFPIGMGGVFWDQVGSTSFTSGGINYFSVISVLDDGTQLRVDTINPSTQALISTMVTSLPSFYVLGNGIVAGGAAQQNAPGSTFSQFFASPPVCADGFMYILVYEFDFSIGVFGTNYTIYRMNPVTGALNATYTYTCTPATCPYEIYGDNTGTLYLVLANGSLLTISGSSGFQGITTSNIAAPLSSFSTIFQGLAEGDASAVQTKGMANGCVFFVASAFSNFTTGTWGLRMIQTSNKKVVYQDLQIPQAWGLNFISLAPLMYFPYDNSILISDGTFLWELFLPDLCQNQQPRITIHR